MTLLGWLGRKTSTKTTTGMIFVWYWLKFFQRFGIHAGFCLIWQSKKNLIIKKYSCQKPLDWFKYNLAEIFLWWPKIALAIMIHHKIMATRGRDLFSPYIYIENFKNLLVVHHWTHFNVIWQKCFCSDFQPSCSSHKKKWPPGGAGLINPIYLYKKSLNSSCQKPLDRFQYNLEEMFLWWPSTKIVQVIMIHNKHDCRGAGLIFPKYLYRKL